MNLISSTGSTLVSAKSCSRPRRAKATLLDYVHVEPLFEGMVSFILPWVCEVAKGNISR